jgi:hypothetical protein
MDAQASVHLGKKPHTSWVKRGVSAIKRHMHNFMQSNDAQGLTEAEGRICLAQIVDEANERGHLSLEEPYSICQEITESSSHIESRDDDSISDETDQTDYSTESDVDSDSSSKNE